MLATLEKRTLAGTRALAALGLAALIFYAAMTLLDGTLRSLANHPIEAVRDIGGLYVAVAVACCFPLAFLERSNIAIRFAESMFGRRVGDVLDALGAVAVEVAVVLIAWRLFVYGFQARRAHDITFMLAAPIAPFWLACASLIAITALVQLVVIAVAIGRCLDPGAARPRPGMAGS
jgi:TRAP-type transport system small permease protein